MSGEDVHLASNIRRLIHSLAVEIASRCPESERAAIEQAAERTLLDWFQGKFIPNSN